MDRFASRRTVVLGAIGLLLAWLIVSHSLVALLSRSAPELALWLEPDNSVALLRLSEQRLDEKPRLPEKGTGAKRDPVAERAARLRSEPEIQALARRALQADPLNARALRLLGEATDAGAAGAKGEAASAARAAGFMRAAARLSGREAVATEWMMRYSLAQKDFPASE